jgi:hypothetical protein
MYYVFYVKRLMHDFVEEVRRITDDKGVTAVLDMMPANMCRATSDASPKTGGM